MSIFKYANWPKLKEKRTGPFSWFVHLVHPAGLSRKSYELFKKELDIWEITSPVLEEKRGAVITALLPNDCLLKKDLKDKFFETVDVRALASKEGLMLVKNFLGKHSN